jgi:hypothetical protein
MTKHKSSVIAVAVLILPLQLITTNGLAKGINEKGLSHKQASEVSCEAVKKDPKEYPDLMARCGLDQEPQPVGKQQVNKSKSNVKNN